MCFTNLLVLWRKAEDLMLCMAYARSLSVWPMRSLSLSALYGSALPAGLSTKRDTASTAVRPLPDLAPYVSRQHARTALYVSLALYGGHALIVSLTPSLFLSISARSVSMCLCLTALSVQMLSNCSLCRRCCLRVNKLTRPIT